MSSFTRPTGSFNAPGPPKLPTGWRREAAPEVAARRARRGTGGTGGLYGAPPRQMAATNVEGDPAEGRTMQLTVGPRSGREDRPEIGAETTARSGIGFNAPCKQQKRKHPVAGVTFSSAPNSCAPSQPTRAPAQRGRGRAAPTTCTQPHNIDGGGWQGHASSANVGTTEEIHNAQMKLNTQWGELIHALRPRPTTIEQQEDGSRHAWRAEVVSMTT